MTQRESKGVERLESISIDSSSPVEADLVSTVKDGKVMGEEGKSYSTIQEAVNNSSKWIYIGKGTFNEAVSVSRADFYIEGSGYDTVVDGGASGNAVTSDSSSDRMTVKDIEVTSDNKGLETNGSDTTVFNVKGVDCATVAIQLIGEDSLLINSRGDRSAFNIDTIGQRCITQGCASGGSSNTGILMGGNNSITSFSTSDLDDNDGINLNELDNSILIGCRVIDPISQGIDLTTGADNIIANCRVSTPGAEALIDNGTGTVLDGNSFDGTGTEDNT